MCNLQYAWAKYNIVLKTPRPVKKKNNYNKLKTVVKISMIWLSVKMKQN